MYTKIKTTADKFGLWHKKRRPFHSLELMLKRKRRVRKCRCFRRFVFTDLVPNFQECTYLSIYVYIVTPEIQNR